MTAPQPSDVFGLTATNYRNVARAAELAQQAAKKTAAGLCWSCGGRLGHGNCWHCTPESQKPDYMRRPDPTR